MCFRGARRAGRASRRHRLHSRSAAACAADELQPVLPLPVVGQQAVDVAARHAAVGACRAVDLAVAEPEQRPQRAGRAADMHLVSLERHGAIRGLAACLDQHLVAFEHRLDIEQAEAIDLLRRPLDAMWIGDGAAQHLIAAADAEHESAAPQMRLEVDVPAELPQRREIGDGRFRPGQDDQPGIARHRSCGPTKTRSTPGSSRSGSKSSKLAMRG